MPHFTTMTIKQLFAYIAALPEDDKATQKLVIDYLDQQMKLAAELRGLLDGEHTLREECMQQGMPMLADRADKRIEVICEMLEKIEGPCADWDELVA